MYILYVFKFLFTIFPTYGDNIEIKISYFKLSYIFQTVIFVGQFFFPDYNIEGFSLPYRNFTFPFYFVVCKYT